MAKQQSTSFQDGSTLIFKFQSNLRMMMMIDGDR
jgi:hypothetical protein